MSATTISETHSRSPIQHPEPGGATGFLPALPVPPTWKVTAQHPASAPHPDRELRGARAPIQAGMHPTPRGCQHGRAAGRGTVLRLQPGALPGGRQATEAKTSAHRPAPEERPSKPAARGDQLLQTHSSSKKKNPERSLALGPKLREEINQRITGNTHRLPGSRQHIHSSQTSHKSGREGLCWRHSNAQKPPKSSPAPGQQQPPSPPARGAREQPGEPQLSVLSVRRGPAPATTASLFNPQQLYSHSARQIDFTSPQLNVDNYGCLHQGTALPGLRRKNHIPIPLML